MSEESMLILKMLQDGKITAAQAEALLTSVRNPAAPQPAAPAQPDPSTLASIQSKLGELQNKLGEIQGRQVADRAARIAGTAATVAGKVIGRIPRPEIDLRKAIDETLTGLAGLKEEAVRTAKQAAIEARRVAKDAKKAAIGEFTAHSNGHGFGIGPVPHRPVAAAESTVVTEETETSIPYTAKTLTLVNRYGNISVQAAGGEGEPAISIKAAKTAWSTDESAARVLLQQVFVTNRAENGNVKVDVIAPLDAGEHITVDCAIVIPAGVPAEIETTFGDVTTTGAGPVLTVKSVSGSIAAGKPLTLSGGDARLATRSGSIDLVGWALETGSVTAQTVSGRVTADGIGGDRDIVIHTQSGDIELASLAVRAGMTAESVSGDVIVKGGTVSTQTTLKTQSGDVKAEGLQSGQIHLESVSGEAAVSNVGGALTLKTVSGDIDGREVNSYSVAINTVSGHARLGFSRAHSGSFAGTSVSGDITLELPAESDARIEMASTSGEVACDLPMEEASTSDPRHLSGKVGAGTGSVRLQSVSGDLKVTKPGKAKKAK